VRPRGIRWIDEREQHLRDVGVIANGAKSRSLDCYSSREDRALARETSRSRGSIRSKDQSVLRTLRKDLTRVEREIERELHGGFGVKLCQSAVELPAQRSLRKPSSSSVER
jgi:hypothetical protein